jgi:group I intron endonuclease
MPVKAGQIVAPVYGRVYLLTNKENGMVYVGQTTNTVDRRWTQHRCDAKAGRVAMPICRAIREHGPDVFTVCELAVAYSREDLDALEAGFIAGLNSTAQGYNVVEGGRRLTAKDRVRRGDIRRGIPRPEEVREKISASHLGMKQTVEARLKISLSLQGRPAWNKGKTGTRLSEVTRQKMSEAQKRRWARGR